MATKLEIIQKMKDSEERIEELEFLLDRHHNYYHQSTSIRVIIETGEFGVSNDDKQKYVNVSKKLFMDYLKEELKNEKIKSDDLLKKLIDIEGGYS